MANAKINNLLTAFPVALAYCYLSRVFRCFLGRVHSPTFLAVIVVKEQSMAASFEMAAEFLLTGKSQYGMRMSQDGSRVERIKKKANDSAHILGLAQSPGRLVLIFNAEADVPAEFKAVADIYEVVTSYNSGLVVGALYRMCGVVVSETDAGFILEQPFERTAAAFRKGRSVQRSLQLLRRASTNLEQPGPMAAKEELPVLPVDDLIGYGEARDWGQRLAKDIALYGAGRLRWKDVDPGLLLSGPTGCGKTTFALSLALSCGVPLVHSSAAAWQAAGHLGDLLREMRQVFETAKAQAPCILMIDEIDSLGDRARAGGEYNGYIGNPPAN